MKALRWKLILTLTLATAVLTFAQNKNDTAKRRDDLKKPLVLASRAHGLERIFCSKGSRGLFGRSILTSAIGFRCVRDQRGEGWNSSACSASECVVGQPSGGLVGV